MPTYVWTSPVSSLLTVAWYTTPSVRHFPSNGQDIFRRQLQVSQTVGFVLVCFVSMALLWDESKSRYNNHTSTFRNPKRKHSTALSRYIWNLKDTNANFSLKWKIMKRCKAYSGRTKRCSLCLHEKLFIIRHPEMATLNSRNELISSCRHRKKHLLSTH